MNQICIQDLATSIGGQLRLGSLPPIGGTLEPIRNIVLDADQIQEGDVFWGLQGADGDRSHMAEHAYLQGALGAVIAGRKLEPWAGKFSIEVEDSRLALWQFAEQMRARFEGQVIAVAGGPPRSYVASMIHAALAQQLSGSLVRANSNNLDQAVLSVCQLPATDDYRIVQLDLDQPEELEPLLELYNPQMGILVANQEEETEMSDSQDWDATARTLLQTIDQSATLILDNDDTVLRRSLEPEQRNVVWVGSGPRCDKYPGDLTQHEQRYSFHIQGVRFPALTANLTEVKTVVTACAVAEIMNVSSERVARELKNTLIHSNLISAGTAARPSSVEALPFASTMREADATLPPG